MNRNNNDPFEAEFWKDYFEQNGYDAETFQPGSGPKRRKKKKERKGGSSRFGSGQQFDASAPWEDDDADRFQDDAEQWAFDNGPPFAWQEDLDDEWLQDYLRELRKESGRQKRSSQNRAEPIFDGRYVRATGSSARPRQPSLRPEEAMAKAMRERWDEARLSRAQASLLLGTPTGATAEEVGRARKQLVLQYHPDRNPDNPNADLQLRLVMAAYKIMS